jgi:hypothetical protein
MHDWRDPQLVLSVVGQQQAFGVRRERDPTIYGPDYRSTLRGVCHTCAAEGAGTKSDVPRSAERKSEWRSVLEALRGLIGVAGVSA